MRSRRGWPSPLIALALLVNLAATGYRVTEGWDWGDCYWMVAITISTIGYGEVYPLSHAGRWITVFVVVGGLVVVQLTIQSLGSRSRAIFDAWASAVSVTGCVA